MKHLFTAVLFVIVAAMTTQAQTETAPVPVPPVTTTVPTITTTVPTITTTVPPMTTTMPTIAMPAILSTVEMPPMPLKAPLAATEIFAASSTKVVKDAPFSAEGISESVQTLADGNRITRSTSTKMFRDGDGRFRREGGGGTGSSYGYATMGSLVSVYGMQDTISIFDPVEGTRYVLNPTDKTARRFDVKNMFGEGSVFVYGQTMSPSTKAQLSTTDAAKKALENNAVAKADIVVMPNLVTGLMTGGKTEQLGTKSFEGVNAEGTRTVMTIAAGAIGNERPIEIVYERWYSKELDLIVYSRHYDPRFGEQIYRLVNINRSEPERSLFTVPSDYKTMAEPMTKIYTTSVAPTPAIPVATKPQ